MKTYCATLRLRSATLSPWQADTLFGHLCWLVRYAHGEPALLELLARYRAGDPPLLFSDGCPAGWLPRPLVPHPPAPPDPAGWAIGPAPARGSWVSAAAFAALCQGELPAAEPPPSFESSRVVQKSLAARLTGADVPGDSTYHVEELAYYEQKIDARQGRDLSVYVRAADDAWAERAHDWLTQLAAGGYGARKSAGYGQFTLAGWEPWPQFDRAPEGANGFISLSNWAPARHDPAEGRYHTLVKYGKLGEALAVTEHPFKYPLILLAAGSCFYAAAPIRPWYGRLVEQIAELPDLPIAQYAYAFAVPARLGAAG